ncbi:hypothetical protein ULMS_12270 [Patiriisocius marinistellae]|uniref:Na(+)-translocating NADH-quinone reductase subunit F n=1 Tax=Patiriisocius marinistellae TaxID=2494560 RepID=A0A5J4FZT5_9FLAO|nr:Na(+)-translocating NADH-quinone reductase subunit F [Patiriisocius marinistellae]GEQ85719.1 hypothetical protein ULMS_12270 [Patiriisocius marinistellae]
MENIKMIMETINRFEAAISRLYDAFHSNKLNPECNKQCAVGNICDNKDAWKHFSDFHGSIQLNYVGIVHQRLGRKINGYLPIELLKIEATFLKTCGFQIPLRGFSKHRKIPIPKEVLFEGMVSVIELLCEFDNIPNPMAYEAIFRNEVVSKMGAQIITEIVDV